MRLTVSEIARVCHEVNRAYCLSKGDTSQVAWEDAPVWQVSSAIGGVEAALRNPDAKPSDSHEGWMAQKLKEGWTHGPVKDPIKREHPDLLPYDQMPDSEKAKDHIFLAVVRSLAAIE